MKTLLIIKSIIYCQTVHVFGPFTDACCKKCMAYLLTIFCFRSMPGGNCQFSSASFSLYHWWKITHWYMNLVMAAVELYLNATLYAQHPALKSVYGSYFPPIYGSVWTCTLTGSLRLQNKCLELLLLLRYLSRKERWHDHMSGWGICIIFMSFLIITSFRKLTSGITMKKPKDWRSGI